MRRIALVAMLSIGTGGCSSTIGVVKTRPWAAHRWDRSELVTRTGERTMVAKVELNLDGTVAHPMLICTEGPPPTAQSITASSKPSLKVSKFGEIGTDDGYATQLTITGGRALADTNLAEMAWNACSEFAAGALTREEYRTAMATVRAKQEALADAYAVRTANGWDVMGASVTVGGKADATGTAAPKAEVPATSTTGAGGGTKKCHGADGKPMDCGKPDAKPDA